VTSTERPFSATVAVGDELPGARYALDRTTLVRYAGASGDFNPIHWNERFAREVGLPDVIAHGMLTMATAARMVSDWVQDPGDVIEYGVRFTSPVVVPDPEGTAVDVVGKVGAVDPQAGTARIDLTVTCAGQKVLGKACAIVRLR
jgi:acyl dehydratase